MVVFVFAAKNISQIILGIAIDLTVLGGVGSQWNGRYITVVNNRESRVFRTLLVTILIFKKAMSC